MFNAIPSVILTDSLHDRTALLVEEVNHVAEPSLAFKNSFYQIADWMDEI